MNSSTVLKGSIISAVLATAIFAFGGIAFAATAPTTLAANGITSSDATLNGTNGDTGATDHTFWVSTSTFSTPANGTPFPANVYSTPSSAGAVAPGASFSASLSSVTGLPTVTPSTTYYFAAWTFDGTTWTPGTVEHFTTLSLSTDAAVTSSTYTVSALASGAGTITNVPSGTAKAAFLAALVPAAGATLTGTTAITDPVVSGNTLVITAQDGTTIATYTVTVNAAPVVNSTTGVGYSTIQAAINAASAGNTITLGSDITVTSQVNITQAITLDGGGHTLSASFTKTDNTNNSAIGVSHNDVTIQNLKIDDTLGTNLHGVNVYLANTVALNNVTISNNSNGAAMIVNGSSVTATDLNTSNNAWGSVNVDPGSGVTAPSVFTLVSGTLGDGTQIWSDGGNVTSTATVTVSAPSDYKQYAVAGKTAYYIWANKPVSNGATIAGDSTNTVYPTIQAAIDAAPSGGTVNVGSGTYNESLIIANPVILQSTGGRDVTTVKSLTVATSSVTVSGFTIEGVNTSGVASTNVFLNSGVSNITVSNNKIIKIGSGVDNVGGDSGVGLLTTSDLVDIGDNLNVTDNIFQALDTGSNRAFYINPGINHFTFSGNTITGNFTGTSITQAQNGLVENNTVTGAGAVNSRSAGLGTWGYPDATVWGHTTFSGNTVSGTRKAIAVYETNNVSISGNTLSGNGMGVWVGDATPIPFDITTVAVHNNDLSNEDTYGVTNASATTTKVDASSNWWGSASATKVAGLVSGLVNYTPWFANSGMTATNSGINSDNGTNATSTVAADIATTTSTTAGNVSLDIPAGTVVTGPAGWDGSIELPTVVTTTVAPTADDGFTNPTAVISIEVGSTTAQLTFNPAVKLTFVNQGSNYVGWSFNGGAFVPIDQVCDSATNPTTFSANGDCKITSGSDLIVWTKHFTTFTTYTQTAIPPVTTTTTTSGGGGGGGGGISGSYGQVSNGYGGYVTTGGTTGTGTGTGSVGQVLGAAAYNFANNLTIGSTGNDVTELQKLLLAAGFSIPALTNGTASYGYFGGQTQAAVIAFQKAHGITPAVGYVGPITRAQLNLGTTPTMSDEQRSLLIQSLKNQLQAILAQIQQMIASGVTS
jgi:parallel beta-helix repeat protein